MIKNEWLFNEEFLRDAIKRGNKLLLDPKTSKGMKINIQDTIIEFQNFLKAINREPFEEEQKNNLNFSFPETKDKVLTKIKKDYQLISHDLMDLIIYLEKRKKEISFKNQYKRDIDIESLVEDTYFVYDTYFPNYRDTAFNILNHPFSLVHITKEKIFESECHGSSFIKLPFIYASNVDEYPLSLGHELQHGVEFMHSYKTHPYYYELGPIVLETLYIDHLLNKKSADAELLYGIRLMEMDSILYYLAGYFEATKKIIKLGNNVSNTRFMDILENYDLVLEDTLQDDLEEILELDLKKYLCYVLSFLKSLDVRNNIYNSRKIGAKQLHMLLDEGKFKGLENKKEVLNTYDSFLKEVSCYQKGKQKRKMVNH